MTYSLFISCPKGLEYLLSDEVSALGFIVQKVSPQGVYGHAELALIYRLCLWTRLANRVQLILSEGPATDPKSLYASARQVRWHELFSVEKTISIECHGVSDTLRNSLFSAQVIKDAIVDHYREHSGQRPNVDRDNPQIRVHAFLKNDRVTLSLDLVGYSLHQRGYRRSAGAAPLKENIAAALLYRAQWPQLAAVGASLHDPFCGSGTLVIEAAMMAARIAPGLLREDQALQHWSAHDEALWQTLRETARQQRIPTPGNYLGSDLDPQAIAMARRNAEAAGVGDELRFQAGELKDCQPPKGSTGLLIGNPPYGERLSELDALEPLYRSLGQVLHQRYQGWQAAIITSEPSLAKAIGLRAHKHYAIYNGALACKLYCFAITADNQWSTKTTKPLSAGAAMFANRLQKNDRHLKKWAKRNGISCYRLYDADLPEYAVAIDRYEDHVVVQEYAAPSSIDATAAEQRRQEVLQAVPQVLNLSPQRMVFKQRQKQKGSQQYQKIQTTQHALPVNEGRAVFQVNLQDYLDTGLFLDHRPLRLEFAQLAPGTRFLNCFCYTATASVHAALAGAWTTNVDLSNTYLAWAETNFTLNGLDLARHQFIAYDCLEWLSLTRDRFDVIFLDPPSFSNSKRMATTLDIQRDHDTLIRSAMTLLKPGGKLIFSTNFRRFRLNDALSLDFVVTDITERSIDLDFKRNQRIHRCYELRQR